MRDIQNPLKNILSLTQHHWDQADELDAIRETVQKAHICRTTAVGTEVYASSAETKVFCHRCKGRPCCQSDGAHLDL
jgi:hypothetical protein